MADNYSPVVTEFSSDLLDSVAVPIAVFDSEGRLSHWNRSLAEVTGHSDERPSSTTLDDLFDDADRIREAVERTLDTGCETFDADVSTTTGTETTYEFTATVYTTSASDAPSVVAIGHDVTAARRRERAATRYEVVLDSLADAVYAIEPDGTLVYVNDRYAAMKGVSRETLLGTNIDDWVSEEAAERANEVRAVLASGDRDTATLEYEFVADDGTRFPAELRFGSVGRDDTDIDRVGTIRDVTKRVEREEAIQRQNERLDEFASIVSHDLRNPLTVAEGRLELAREECDSDQLAAVEDAHARIRRLIDQILALAREGQTETDCETVAFGALVEDCWDAVATPTATLVVETDATVHADERQLRRLLGNLLRNAIEHGGDVTVTVGSLADGFFVEDDGPGILPEHHDDVFEAGYSTRQEGTGFGLSIVREVVDAHGWDVDLAAGDDGGARFEIRGVTMI